MHDILGHNYEIESHNKIKGQNNDILSHNYEIKNLLKSQNNKVEIMG